MSNNFDLRTMTKAELVAHIVEYKACAWTLADQSDEDVRAWAEGKDRQWLIDIAAGWGKDALIQAGLRRA